MFVDVLASTFSCLQVSHVSKVAGLGQTYLYSGPSKILISWVLFTTKIRHVKEKYLLIGNQGYYFMLFFEENILCFAEKLQTKQ